MSYNNKIIRRLHNHLLAPLEWLEQLEQHDGYCQHPAEQPLPAHLSATLAGLESTLEQLVASFQFEEQQLFGLIESAGRASAIDALQPRRQRISRLTAQLLISTSCIRSLAKLLPSGTDLQAHQFSSGENGWDDVLRRVRDLNNLLVRYIYTAESTYLPIADHLLGPSGQIEIRRPSELPRVSSATSAALAQTYSMQSQQLH